MTFPKRISRQDAIAIVNRGGDYPVHAARDVVADSVKVRYKFRTACGRLMTGLVNHHPDETNVSCQSCMRATSLETWRDKLARLEEAVEPLVEFIDKFDRRPLGNIADEFYSIHAGEDGAALRLSDLRKLREIVRS